MLSTGGMSPAVSLNPRVAVIVCSDPINIMVAVDAR